MDSTNDGWTHVRRNKGRRALQATPQQSLPDRAVTVELLLDSYTRYARVWKASSCRKELRQILDKKQPDEGWEIQEAICIASGSFSRDNLECRKRSMLQFVAFIDTVAHVQSTSSTAIKLYAEELVYTAVDIDFLSSMDITVHNDAEMIKHLAEHPTAWSYIGPQSMVFELYMEMSIPPMLALLQCGAKLLVASPLPERLATVASEPVAQAVKAFAAVRRSYFLPRFEEDPGVFEGLQVYWNEPKDEDDETGD